MDPIRDGLVRFVDNTASTLQHVARTFGFLPDGRELVQMERGPDGLVLTFSDRTPEGWPGFQLDIPAGAKFDQAYNGLLSRRASWILRQPVEEVVRHLEKKNEGFPSPLEDRERGVAFRLWENVELGIVGYQDEVSYLHIRQLRDPDSIKEAVEARARSIGERWGVPESDR